jgi:hypothetical protein
MKKLDPNLNISQLRIEEGKKYSLDQSLTPVEPLR